jgi:hypothetical protein
MSFMKLLQEHRHGNTHEDISEQIRTLVAAVSDEGKSGKLVITLSVKPMGKGDGLEVSIDLKLTPPKPAPGASIFFATPGGDLTRQDPRQSTMELREAPPAHVARNLAS